MRGWWRRLVELVRPSRLDREIVEELTHHVDLLIERKRASGLDAGEARRQALAEVGSILPARQRIAEERPRFPVDQLARELTWSARLLRRSPGISSLSIVTLAIGIGGSAMLFALVDGIVFRPLPYPEPARLVRIFDTNADAGIDRTGAASGNIVDWRRRARVFEGVAGYFAMGRTVSIGDQSEVLLAAQVTAGFFDLLGVTPMIGRTFTTEETERAAFNGAASPVGPDPVLVLSHRLWLQQFGGDPGVIGRSVVLERRPFTIVGVMPRGFAMPDAGVQLWLPWRIDDKSPRDQHYLGAVARLSAGVSIAAAGDRLNAIARDLAAEHPVTNKGWGVRLSPLASETVGDVESALWVLSGSVGVVLLVACANVALLSLIRGFDRRGEVAVRLALGASSPRLVREMFWEAAWLAFGGGLGGIAIASFGLRLMPALTTLPRLDEVTLDARVLLFIAAVTAISALVAGLPQAWRRTRISLPADLSSSALRSTGSRPQHRVRDGIVVIQVAMTVVLMTGAGLFIRSVLNLRATSLGFDPDGVLLAPVFLDTQAYGTTDKARAYYATLFERLSALPGVVAVGGATRVPTSQLGPDFERPVWPEGTLPERASAMTPSVRIVTPGYFKAIGLRIGEGRAFSDGDAPDAPRVVMVSESVARRMWPGQSAVGRRLIVDYSTSGTYAHEVIGVVDDIRFRGPRSPAQAEIYLPHAQRPYLVLNVVVKTAGDPRALMPAVRAVFRDVDAQKPAQGQYVLTDLVATTYTRERQMTAILVVFALAGTLLTGLGIYGVLSQRVRERSREIGIRRAVGGGTPQVIAWVAGSGLRLIVIGLVIGFAIAFALARTLESFLFGVGTSDGVTVAAVLGVTALVGVIGIVEPLLRAIRINPIDVLRRS